MKQLGVENRSIYFTSLQVNVQIEESGDMSVFHEKLPQNSPYISEKNGNGRLLGKNAARMVKGLSFIEK